MSRALAAESAIEVRRKKGWSYVSMSAYKVKPDPFWKSVRPVVPKDVIYGTFVTAKTYTTCFTGVVVPYVCTSGRRSAATRRSSASEPSSIHCSCRRRRGASPRREGVCASRLPQQMVSSPSQCSVVMALKQDSNS